MWKDDIFEFQEEDIFFRPKEGQDSCSNSNLRSTLNYSFGLALERPFVLVIPTVPRIILKGNKDGGGCQEPTPSKLTAPRKSSHIRTPDWYEIYQLTPIKEIWEAICYLEKAPISKRRQVKFFDDESSDDDDREFIPQHIIVARREAANHFIYHSMLERIGKTLKGREFIKFRDRVSRVTGFID